MYATCGIVVNVKAFLSHQKRIVMYVHSVKFDVVCNFYNFHVYGHVHFNIITNANL